MTTVKLEKPFEFDGATVGALELRAPTVADVRKLGYPFTIKDGEIKMDADVVFLYASRLSQIPPAILEKNLSMKDLTAISGAVMSFFG